MCGPLSSLSLYPTASDMPGLQMDKLSPGYIVGGDIRVAAQASGRPGVC